MANLVVNVGPALPSIAVSLSFVTLTMTFDKGYAEGGSGAIGDGLAGLLGGDVATKAMGSIKTPLGRELLCVLK